MKKVLLVLLVGLLLAPSEMFADTYNSKRISPTSHPPRSENVISLYLDYYTGDLAITPNYAISGLEISITAGGVTYLDTTVSLGAGQSYTDCLSYLSVGTYILTLSTADGFIAQYVITVEDD